MRRIGIKQDRRLAYVVGFNGFVLDNDMGLLMSEKEHIL